MLPDLRTCPQQKHSVKTSEGLLKGTLTFDTGPLPDLN